jgi:hypothetical protein
VTQDEHDALIRRLSAARRIQYEITQFEDALAKESNGEGLNLRVNADELSLKQCLILVPNDPCWLPLRNLARKCIEDRLAELREEFAAL